MSIEQIANYAEIVGVILVIGSLIYVGRQLRQNTEMMRAASRNSIQQNHQQEILTMVSYPTVWRGFTGEELSDESIQVGMWLTSSLRSREYEWIQFKNGALDQASWEAFSKAIPLVLSSPRSRAWWEASKIIFDDQFAQQVDDLLEKENFHSVHLAQIAALNTAGADEGK